MVEQGGGGWQGGGVCKLQEGHGSNGEKWRLEANTSLEGAGSVKAFLG
jgi:hypothetical protein